ncbi:MAG: divalent metal cation transporter [Patescibacteria group bacterium]
MSNKFSEKIGALYRIWKRRLFIFFIVTGPGLITAVADNDAGGIATYTVAASVYGMASRFLIIPETFLLIITQEIGARIAIVTKKGLGDLIRERFGVKLALFIFLLYFITNQGVVLQNVAGLKSSFQIFNLPWQLMLVLTSLFLIFVVIKFDYKRLQKIFLSMIFFYFAYFVVAVISKPDWGFALKETLIWPVNTKLDINFWFSRIAVLGTSITAWGQFFISSYVADKKLSVDHLKYQKVEIYIGALITSVVSFMIAIAVSETLFLNNIVVKDGYTAALALKPLAGDLAQGLFAIGLFGASILGLTIVPLATAYVFSELFGYEGSLDISFKKGRIFYSFFVIQIILATAITLIPQIRLFELTIYVDYLNGAMLPVIFYFLILFSENSGIMGKWVTGKFTKYFLRACAVVISIAVIVSFIGVIFNIG